MAVPRVLVVGGNGYLGKRRVYLTNHRLGSVQSSGRPRVVGEQHEVRWPSFPSNHSSSGKPYTSPAGHTPKWVHGVEWHKASAFEPSSYASLVASSSAVVHTLGILLEDSGYKQAVREGNVLGIVRALGNGLAGSGSGNPLKTTEERRAGYEGMNRDSGESIKRP